MSKIEIEGVSVSNVRIPLLLQGGTILDEARERVEKIAEAAEKFEPKSPEERREDMIEEATGVEKDEGILNEIMDELFEATEEMAEESLEEMEKVTDEMASNSAMEQDMITENVGSLNLSVKEEFMERYNRIDFRV